MHITDNVKATPFGVASDEKRENFLKKIILREMKYDLFFLTMNISKNCNKNTTNKNFFVTNCNKYLKMAYFGGLMVIKDFVISLSSSL